MPATRMDSPLIFAGMARSYLLQSLVLRSGKYPGGFF